MSQPTFDITPSPKVLKLLGNIEYAPWQCLAELIDNSVDAFVSAYDSQAGFLYPEVAVSFPTRSRLSDPDASIVVQDNGPGMTSESLEKAVKAGYSGNDPISKLGLFGMGFNIATARLGRRTEVWTTQRDDDLWTGVAIDFDDLMTRQSFQAPRLTKPKSVAEANYHGTRIEISKLEQSKVDEALKAAGKRIVREKLSRTYSNVIQKIGLRLTLDGQELPARRFCTWDASRSVNHQELGEVPAILKLDHNFGPRAYCTTCWVWLETSEKRCPSCASTENLQPRERKVTGWIGLQRYFDEDDYGFDLLRNGRAIVIGDKRHFFEWKSPADGSVIKEYPIDGAVGGRFVGEIQMDFVPVTYQKDAFEWDAPEFRLVYEYLHGRGPILPEIAKQAGFGDDPPSPLRRLHGAFRRTHPAGLRNLIPGDATGKVLNREAQDWAALFQAGESAYQDDTKWYEAALLAEEANKRTSRGTRAQAGTIGTLPFMESGSEAEGEGSSPEPRAFEPEAEPAGAGDAPDPNLTREYELTLGRVTPKLKVESLRILGKRGASRFEVGVTAGHLLFKYAPDHADYVGAKSDPLTDLLTEVAYQLRERAKVPVASFPLTMLADDLREKYFPEKQIVVSQMRPRAKEILDKLALHLTATLAKQQPIAVELVADDERQELRSYLQRLRRDPAEFSQLVESGDFPKCLPRSYVPSLVERFPWAFGDGQFFVFPHQNADEEGRRHWLADVLGALNDLVWVVSDDPQTGLTANEFRQRVLRTSCSLELLDEWSQGG